MAYTVARLIQKDPPDLNRRVHLVVRFSGGDAGEADINRDFYLAPLATLEAQVRVDAESLAGRKVIEDQLAVGHLFPLAPPAPPAPTPFDVWSEKAARLVRLRSLNLTAQRAVDDINALAADVDATYQSPFSAAFAIDGERR